jgi:hypothetical protein
VAATNAKKTQAKPADAPPWERKSPEPAKKSKHLSPTEKASAKRRAKAAGRLYPNLVDNMHASAQKKK